MPFARLLLPILIATGSVLGCSSPEQAPAPVDQRSASAALGPGDPETGRRAFGRCRSCHAVEAGVNRVGPSLAGVVGRKAGAVPGYAYSQAMKTSGLVWSDASLEAYLENPKAHVPGTKMSFAGIDDAQTRRDIVAYLGTLSEP